MNSKIETEIRKIVENERKEKNYYRLYNQVKA
jgi:hypothetical protein